jgi:hypothetical protein
MTAMDVKEGRQKQCVGIWKPRNTYQCVRFRICKLESTHQL